MGTSLRNGLCASDLKTFLEVKAFNPFRANPTKWSNTLKQFVGKLPTNCLSVFDHFVGLALKGLSEPELKFINSLIVEI